MYIQTAIANTSYPQLKRLNNIKDHQIAYKTSKMKVKDNAIIIDGPDTFAAGLAVQCGIQSRAFEQKHLKMFNLVSFIHYDYYIDVSY